MLKPKTRRMLATSRKLKVLSILVVICMLFALTGCNEQESTATSETTTEATTQAITAAPTAEATTEATTATPKPTEAPTTTPTTEATTEATTTEATTEAPTEAPAVTVPDVSDVPQDAQAQAEEWTPENGEGGEPENPEQPIDDGYWHEDPAVTAADLQAAAEAELARLTARVDNNPDWFFDSAQTLRATDTQYGIYVLIGCDYGYREYAIKAEANGAGGIDVGVYENQGGVANDGSYESFYARIGSADDVNLSF